MGDPQALEKLDLPRDRPVVTICPRGKASALAAEQLQARGYDVRNLVGGLKAWSLAWNTAEMTLPDQAATVIQVRRTGKGCLSYLVGSDGEAAVIDPSLETDVYLGLAEAQGWRVSSVLETHLHADHLSRARALAQASGAALYLPAQERVSFAFQPVREGTRIAIGRTTLQALHTPGHTPESTSYLLGESVLFSGDTLFLAGIGRPDLGADTARTRDKALALFESLERLTSLPADIIVLPAHTGEPVPFDQQMIAADLATVTARTEILAMPKSTFLEAILARIPATPPNHERIIEWNEAGVLPDDPTEYEAGANRCAIG